eukprot:Gb_35051 [translate_table: standard]
MQNLKCEFVHFQTSECFIKMEGSHQYASPYGRMQQEEGQTASSLDDLETPLHDAPQLPDSQSTRLQVAPRWTLTEMLVLVREKWAVENELQHSPSKSQYTGASDKWSSISNRCTASNVLRTAGQCRKKWELLISDYKKIKDWERHCGIDSYWSLNHNSKREHKLPFYLERELFDAMDAHLGKTPSTCPEATFDSMDVGADGLFTAEDDSQDAIVKMQHPPPSGSGNEPLDSTVRRKRRRSMSDDDREHSIVSALRENSQNIQDVIRETTRAQMCSNQLDREMYWKGIEVNRQVQLQTSELDRELRKKQSQDLVDVLGEFVNAMNRLVDTIQNKSSQQLN